MIDMLRAQGYEFVYVSELCDCVENVPGIAQIDVQEGWG
jgi:hypothetical protein